MHMATTPLLTACLIVRDESATILGCLDSLRDIADEVIVYDTGSMDKTVTLARIAGATVVQGHWDDDFARARNDALTHCTGEWVLSVDADEVLGADPAALTHLLATAGRVEAFLVPIAQNAGAENYVSHSVKLFRRSAVTWTGMVHERVVGIDGTALATASVPAEVLSLTHSGYANPALAHHKCRRNAAIGLVELRALNEESVPREDELVRVLLDLGRSLMGCGQAQGAADAFSAVRCMSLPHEDPRWLQATELLIRVALTDGKLVEGGELVAQLREAGARSDYCDWLAAQALAQLGQPEVALRMLNRVTELVDSAGRAGRRTGWRDGSGGGVHGRDHGRARAGAGPRRADAVLVGRSSGV
jgi:hypothetical protein